MFLESKYIFQWSVVYFVHWNASSVLSLQCDALLSISISFYVHVAAGLFPSLIMSLASWLSQFFGVFWFIIFVLVIDIDWSVLFTSFIYLFILIRSFIYFWFGSMGRWKTSSVNVIINLLSKQSSKAWFWGLR